MKLLANENFPLDSVKLLRKLNYNIISIGEDRPSISDLLILNVADSMIRELIIERGSLSAMTVNSILVQDIF